MDELEAWVGEKDDIKFKQPQPVNKLPIFESIKLICLIGAVVFIVLAFVNSWYTGVLVVGTLIVTLFWGATEMAADEERKSQNKS